MNNIAPSPHARFPFCTWGNGDTTKHDVSIMISHLLMKELGGGLGSAESLAVGGEERRNGTAVGRSGCRTTDGGWSRRGQVRARQQAVEQMLLHGEASSEREKPPWEDFSEH